MELCPCLRSRAYKLGCDVEDVYQDFYNLGRIFQVEDKANEVVDGMKTKIAEVESKIEGADPIKVFNFDCDMDGGAYTPGDNFTSKLIRHAGGVNVFEDLGKDMEYRQLGSCRRG